MARTTRRRAAVAPTPATAESAAETPRTARKNLPRPSAAGASGGSGGRGPTALGTSGSGGLRPSPRKRRNPLGFLVRLQPRFVADVVAELRKVTWPTFQETRYLTIVVAIVSLAVGIVLGSIDFVFGWTVEKLFF
ncbi:MAG: preprotein translocase subunit SecE [Anaerolinea sp.]|nr:preprotein translocase subunit SecE [Anaerolinea sp.]